MSIFRSVALSTQPTSPATGDHYTDDGTNTPTGQPQLGYYDGASWNYLGDVSSWKKASMILSGTVANTVTETTLFGTLKTGDSLQFAANTLEIGNTIRVTMRGIISNTSTPTLNIILKLGTTEIVSTGAITTASGLSNDSFSVSADFTVRTIGASGTVIGGGALAIDANRYGMTNSSDATSAVTIDTTSAQTLSVTATWGTASASNTVTTQTAIAEVLI